MVSLARLIIEEARFLMVVMKEILKVIEATFLQFIRPCFVMLKVDTISHSVQSLSLSQFLSLSQALTLSQFLNGFHTKIQTHNDQNTNSHIQRINQTSR